MSINNKQWLGLPLNLLWGYIAIAVFMTGDGFELAFLSHYIKELGFSPAQASFAFTLYGLAAALSTADGLLLTIASALSHDLYYKMIDPNASTARRVTISKVLLLIVALCAAYLAAQKPADILFLVSAAFSFAAAAFFPALTLGIFWKRATGVAASLGMAAGLGITFYYMLMTQPWLREIFRVTKPVELWWGIQPISAGVFGVALGFALR